MSDHPTTFRAEPGAAEHIEWGDRASIHRRDSGDGVLEGMRALHRGTFAEMIAMFRDMPPEQSADLVIEKAGDRRYEPAEIAYLAQRGDFPG